MAILPLNKKVSKLTKEIMDRYIIAGVTEYEFLTIHLNCLFALGKQSVTKLNPYKGKSIKQTKNNGRVEFFTSEIDAANFFGVDRATISRICHGKCKQHPEWGTLEFRIKKPGNQNNPPAFDN